MLSKAIEFMVSSTPDVPEGFSTRGITVSLELSDEYTRTCQGYTHNISDIVLHPVVIWVYHQIEQGQEELDELSALPEDDPALYAPLGRSVLYALAHEFRHVQQELDTSGSLPRVAVTAALCTAFGSRLDADAYRSDPGEDDADAYAAMICDKATEALLTDLGKYTIYWLRGGDEE